VIESRSAVLIRRELIDALALPRAQAPAETILPPVRVRKPREQESSLNPPLHGNRHKQRGGLISS